MKKLEIGTVTNISGQTISAHMKISLRTPTGVKSRFPKANFIFSKMFVNQTFITHMMQISNILSDKLFVISILNLFAFSSSFKTFLCF